VAIPTWSAGSWRRSTIGATSAIYRHLTRCGARRRDQEGTARQRLFRINNLSDPFVQRTLPEHVVEAARFWEIRNATAKSGAPNDAVAESDPRAIMVQMTALISASWGGPL
jgi:hypothetical protein